MIGRLSVTIACIARNLRAVLGAPDYERYLLHEIQAHPDRQPMSRDQFMCDRLENRYNKPGSKCC